MPTSVCSFSFSIVTASCNSLFCTTLVFSPNTTATTRSTTPSTVPPIHFSNFTIVFPILLHQFIYLIFQHQLVDLLLQLDGLQIAMQDDTFIVDNQIGRHIG